jgi:anthranilate phosphoribosyltransferase
LLPVRDEIGKPPLASLELLWTPHYGDHLLMSGFVHPPTEKRAWEALAAAGETDVLTVKGLEGYTDLPTSRTGITGRFRGDTMERARSLVGSRSGERLRRELLQQAP